MSSCVTQTKRVLMTGHDQLLVMHIWYASISNSILWKPLPAIIVY